jgi:ferredoxin
MALRPQRLQLDPIACDGYGHCAELAGETISLDEWGYPIVEPGPVHPRFLEVAELAVAQCPRRALTLVPVDVPVARTRGR